MKRIFILGLVILTLASTPTQGAETSSARCGDSKIKRLTVWYSLPAYEGVVKELIARFERANPGITIALVSKTDYTVTLKEFRELKPAARPDLVLFPEYLTQQLIDSDQFTPVSRCLPESFLSEIHQPIRMSYATSKTTWAMPFNAAMPVLIFNASIFRAVGLDPSNPPDSPEELLSAAETIQASGQVANAVAIDTAPDGGGPWFVEQWSSTRGNPITDGHNGRRAQPTRLIVDAATDDGLEWLRKLKPFTVNLGPNASGTDNLRRLIDPTQRAAITLNSSAVLRPIIDQLETGLLPGIELGVGPQPSPAPGGLVGGGAWWLPTFGSGPKSASVVAFVRYMASAEAQATLASKTGYVAVNLRSASVPELTVAWAQHPELRVAYDELLKIANDPLAWNPLIGPRTDVRRALSAAAQEVWNGKSPSEAIDAIQPSIDEILTTYKAKNKAKK